jgi:hypothetical protein
VRPAKFISSATEQQQGANMSNRRRPASIIRKSGKASIGLVPLAEAQLRRMLRRSVPSEPWVDAQFKNLAGVDDRGAPLIRRIYDPQAFPPGGADTAMIRCPRCGVLTPPVAFERGICLDHAEHSPWGPSPSAIAIAALQHRNLRLADTPLPPESVAALRAEIRRFEKATQCRGKRLK